MVTVQLWGVREAKKGKSKVISSPERFAGTENDRKKFGTGKTKEKPGEGGGTVNHGKRKVDEGNYAEPKDKG